MREMNFLFLEPEVPENVNGSDVSQNTVLTKRHYKLWGIRMSGMEVVLLWGIIQIIIQIIHNALLILPGVSNFLNPEDTSKNLRAEWGGLGSSESQTKPSSVSLATFVWVLAQLQYPIIGWQGRDWNAGLELSCNQNLP